MGIPLRHVSEMDVRRMEKGKRIVVMRLDPDRGK